LLLNHLEHKQGVVTGVVTFGPHVLLSFFCAEPLTVFALHGQSVLLFVYGSASICICLGLDRALPSSHVYIIGHPIAGVLLRRPLPVGANDLLLPTALNSLDYVARPA